MCGDRAVSDLAKSGQSAGSDLIPLSAMRDYRETRKMEPVFDPKRGHVLRERIYSTWRDVETGKLMGSWRWA